MKRADRPRLDHLDDTDLVRLCQRGESSAFEVLMVRYRHRFLKTAVSILRNSDDAEDEIQNAFLSAYRHIGDFQQNSQFSTWMNRIVINQCLMRLRSQRRCQHTPIDAFQLGNEIATLDLPDRRASPEETLATDQLKALVLRELQRVPGVLRDPMLLTHVQELPLTETAKRLGLSVMAVKSRLSRGRRELRIRLERHLGAARTAGKHKSIARQSPLAIAAGHTPPHVPTATSVAASQVI